MKKTILITGAYLIIFMLILSSVFEGNKVISYSLILTFFLTTISMGIEEIKEAINNKNKCQNCKCKPTNILKS